MSQPHMPPYAGSLTAGLDASRPVIGQRAGEPLDLTAARAYSAAVLKMILLGNELLDAAQTTEAVSR